MRARLSFIVFLWFVGCGSGEQGPLQNDSEEPATQERAGAVYVRNETPYPLQVAFLNEVVAEDIYIVRTTVAVAARAMVSGGELPAGHRAEFDFALEVPAQEGPRVRRKASLRIDGERVLRAILEQADEPFSLLVEAVP